MVDSWLAETDNWAVCDVLATQGIRKAVKGHEKELAKFIDKEYEKRGVYRKRFALVASINLVRQGKPGKARALLERAGKEKYPMIRKAVEWVERELEKSRGPMGGH